MEPSSRTAQQQTEPHFSQVALPENLPLPVEIFMEIFSYLGTREVENCRLICRALKELCNDLRHPHFRWVLRSAYVYSLEVRKRPPLIVYEENGPQVRDFDQVMRSYARQNHFKLFINSLSLIPGKNKTILLTPKAFNHLHLALDQGSKHAVQIIQFCLQCIRSESHGEYARSLNDRESEDNSSSGTIQQRLYAHMQTSYVTSSLDLGKEESQLDLRKELENNLEKYAEFGSEFAIKHLLKKSKKDHQQWIELATKFAYQGSEFAIKHLLKKSKKDHQQWIELATKFAYQGSEYAIDKLLLAYILGKNGLNRNDPAVQQRGLKLAEEFAYNGSSIAIQRLLYSYMKVNTEKFPLDIDDPKVQQNGLRLAKELAFKGYVPAIDILLSAYVEGKFGLCPLDKETCAEGLKLTEDLALKGFSTAIQKLITVYKKGCFGLIPGEKETQQKLLEFFERLIDNTGKPVSQPEVVIEIYLEDLIHLKHAMQNEQIMIKGIILALKLAEEGSQVAQKFLLRAFLLSFGFFENMPKFKHEKIPNTRESWLTLFETYAEANKRSEKTIRNDLEDLYKKQDFSNLFEKAKEHGQRGSEAALDFLTSSFRISFTENTEDDDPPTLSNSLDDEFDSGEDLTDIELDMSGSDGDMIDSGSDMSDIEE